jgi:hypothetical protein
MKHRLTGSTCKFVAALCVVPVLCAGGYVNAQTNSEVNFIKGQGTPSQFQWNVVPFAWLVSLEGDAGINGFKTELDVEFSDAIKGADSLLSAMLHVEASTKDWSVFLATTFIHLGVDDISGGVGIVSVDADVTSNLGWLELGGAIPLVGGSPTSFRDPEDPDLKVDAYAGARLSVIHLELETNASLFGIPVSSASEDLTEVWIEPIIGVRARKEFSEQMLVHFRGDVGGFGAGSDFSWSAMVTLAFEWEVFDRPATGFLGYRALSQDYDSSGFEWDATAHGPILGLELVF